MCENSNSHKGNEELTTARKNELLFHWVHKGTHFESEEWVVFHRRANTVKEKGKKKILGKKRLLKFSGKIAQDIFQRS